MDLGFIGLIAFSISLYFVADMAKKSAFRYCDMREKLKAMDKSEELNLDKSPALKKELESKELVDEIMGYNIEEVIDKALSNKK